MEKTRAAPYFSLAYSAFAWLGAEPTKWSPPAQTLAVVEKMLKQNIPVVFAYIADAHDNEEGSTLSSEHTFEPGGAPYVKSGKGRFFETRVGRPVYCITLRVEPRRNRNSTFH